ncbi:hypothetical protein ACIG87_02620 [Micromonospora sp. NPDC051925]|uniref:hypothetical protein n=1 Tax=Micromonospora sp. NPDC051925 TaxID=3364288 RepID=UPI0037CAF7FF
MSDCRRPIGSSPLPTTPPPVRHRPDGLLDRWSKVEQVVRDEFTERFRPWPAAATRATARAVALDLLMLGESAPPSAWY